QLKYKVTRQHLESTNASLRELVSYQLKEIEKQGHVDQFQYFTQLQKLKQFRRIHEKLKQSIEVETQKLKEWKESNRQRKLYLQKSTARLHALKLKWSPTSITHLDTLRNEILLIQETNAHACRVLVNELIKLFRLNPGQSKLGMAPTVHGLPIPDDVNYKDTPKEHLNTALGHAVHLINLISIYLGFHLPFHLHFEASTSSAHFHHDRLHPIPIYEGTDSFPLGLTMLMYQICYLADQLGVTYTSSFSILTNLLACCSWITSSSSSSSSSSSIPFPTSSGPSSSSSTHPPPKNGHPLRFRPFRQLVTQHLCRSTVELGYPRMIQPTKDVLNVTYDEDDDDDDDGVTSSDELPSPTHPVDLEVPPDEDEWVRDGFEAPVFMQEDMERIEASFEQVQPWDTPPKKWVHLSVHPTRIDVQDSLTWSSVSRPPSPPPPGSEIT
ncbi:hypothetical protein HMI56_000551, partial [Coelomomyces lativittatus]